MKKKATKSKVTKASVKSKSMGQKSGIQPLGDRILIRPLSPEESGHTLASGIIIPDTVGKEKPDQGVVVAIGLGKRNEKGEHIKPEVKAGDRVYFSKPWNDPVKIKGVEYYVVGESDIFAVIN